MKKMMMILNLAEKIFQELELEVNEKYELLIEDIIDIIYFALDEGQEPTAAYVRKMLIG